MRARLRKTAVRAFFRRQSVREAVTLVRWPRLRKAAPDIAHVALYGDGVDGAVQRDEALFLHGLIRTIRPLTAVELGFQRGKSTLNFLRALDDEARLYSFDIEPDCVRLAEERFGDDPRFTFRLRSQAEIRPEDVDGRQVDFVFFDASHDLELNQGSYRCLEPLLTADAVLAVHDTSVVPRELLPADHWLRGFDEGWTEEGWEGQPGERAFLNWLRDEHPEWAQVNLHSARVIRNGITLLQRSSELSRAPDGRSTPWPWTTGDAQA